MPSTGHDRLLRWFVVAFGAETAVAMLLVLAGVTMGGRGHRSLDHVLAWFALGWFVLLVAVFWRAVGYVRQLRGLLGARDEQIAIAAATSHDWLWASDPTMIATYCSPAVSAILGLQPNDIVGHSLFEFVCEDDHARLHDVTRKALRDGTGWEDVEARWKHADGHLVVIHGSALPVHNEHGVLVGFRGTRRVAEPNVLAMQRLAQTTARVRAVLDGETLTVALQPIVSFDGRWIAVEALARFDDGRPPDVWFTEATAVGLGVELELLALRRALADAAQLPPEVLLSLNTSPAAILDPRLPKLLTSSALPLNRVVLELTEHSQVGCYDHVDAVLKPLRAQGLQLAVDDAGAGYASFTHVLQLRPDVIKLDRSLIAGIDADPARRAFVTAIALLGLELGASLTAEGVETQSELTALANLGVDHAQGYLLGRPTTDPACWREWQGIAWPQPDGQPPAWSRQRRESLSAAVSGLPA